MGCFFAQNLTVFEKPKPKEEITLVSSDNVGELINLLHNEAKAI